MLYWLERRTFVTKLCGFSVFNSPFVGADQEGDRITVTDVSTVVDILDRVGNEEAFAALLVTHATHAVLH